MAARLIHRCERHEWEWFSDHAGCPRCLKEQRDALADELRWALSHIEHSSTRAPVSAERLIKAMDLLKRCCGA